jgi:hypothetical protein
MIIKKYENFGMPYQKHFIFMVLLMICGYLGVYIAKNYWPFFLIHNSFIISYFVIFTFSYLCVIFALAFYKIYHISCPICHSKTITESSRKEVRDIYSAYCSQCDVLWNLGIGSDG